MQKHVGKIITIIISSLFLGGCNITNIWDKKPSGIDITTTPVSSVYLDDKLVGQTPYKNDNIISGDHVLKLVPSSADTNQLTEWSTKLKLVPQTTTIIVRNFSPSDADTASSILELQPEKGSNQAFLSIISDPDTVNVTIDNKPHGFTPLKKIALDPGNHSLVVSSPGYQSQSLVVNLVAGYNLLANLKLASESITLGAAPSPSPSSSPTPDQIPSISPTPLPSPTASAVATTAAVTRPYVKINDTPDTQSLKGLNVRSQASSSSDIIGLAKIDELLPYISSNPAGWHQVKFEGQSGWVSGKYTTVYK